MKKSAWGEVKPDKVKDRINFNELTALDEMQDNETVPAKVQEFLEEK